MAIARAYLVMSQPGHIVRDATSPKISWMCKLPDRRLAAGGLKLGGIRYPGIAVPLPPDDARVAFPFPVIDWIVGGPRAHQLLVLAAQTQFVRLVHIEGDPCRPPTHFLSGLNALAFEVDDRLTGAVHRGGRAGPGAVSEVVTIAIDLANRWNEIVQITFGSLEHRVGVGAMLAAAALPALTLMTQYPRGNDVLPLDAPCADSILAGLKAAARKVDDPLNIRAAAVKVLLDPGEDIGQDLLGAREIPMSDGFLAVDELEGGARRRPRGCCSGFGGRGCRWGNVG